MLAFLAIARAIARVKGKAIQMLNDTDLSVCYCIAREHPNALTHAEICEMMEEREQTCIFRSLQRMTEQHVLSAEIVPVKTTRKVVTRYSLGPNAAAQIRFWADQFDACSEESL